mmetsp:Transcript_14175/g.40864  ORF Transcript_14175/g.40864 Transcript_14175/m.40864 type:complete len:338 (+) Transcript_14175:117-1130(+)
MRWACGSRCLLSRRRRRGLRGERLAVAEQGHRLAEQRPLPARRPERARVSAEWRSARAVVVAALPPQRGAHAGRDHGSPAACDEDRVEARPAVPSGRRPDDDGRGRDVRLRRRRRALRVLPRRPARSHCRRLVFHDGPPSAWTSGQPRAQRGSRHGCQHAQVRLRDRREVKGALLRRPDDPAIVARPGAGQRIERLGTVGPCEVRHEREVLEHRQGHGAQLGRDAEHAQCDGREVGRRLLRPMPRAPQRRALLRPLGHLPHPRRPGAIQLDLRRGRHAVGEAEFCLRTRVQRPRRRRSAHRVGRARLDDARHVQAMRAPLSTRPPSRPSAETSANLG